MEGVGMHLDSTVDMHLYKHEAKQDIKHIDPHTITLSFERMSFPYLVKYILGDDLVIRQNALDVICRNLSHSLNVTKALSANLVPALSEIMCSDDEITRIRCIRALHSISQVPSGRTALHKNSIPERIKVLADHTKQSEDIQITAYDTAINIGFTLDGQQALVSNGFVAFLIEKISQVSGAVLARALHTLQVCLKCKAGVSEALESTAVSQCVALLCETDADVLIHALGCLDLLTFSEQGKDQAHFNQIVTNGVPLLLHENDEVRANTALALGNTAQLDAVKIDLIEEGGLASFINMIEDPSEDVKLNVVAALSYLTASPDGRYYLNDATVLGKLEVLTHSDNETLASTTARLIELIKWEP